MTDTASESPHIDTASEAWIDPWLGDLTPLLLAAATSLVALAPPAAALLGPLAPGSITLVRGPRGVGKSWLALAMAQAVAADGSLLGWRARPAPVIHVDAAMSQAALAVRLRALGPASPQLSLVGDCPLDLGTEDDQARLIDALPEGALLVLDGLSLLMPAGRKAAARWQGFCDWLRDLRKDGFAVLLVDHAPRPAVEALADTRIALRPAHDAALAFTAAIVSRNRLDAADRAFTVRLDLGDGTARWTREAVADPALRAVADAARSGATVRDIAGTLGLSTATTWRRLARARALGLVPDDKQGETGETTGAPPDAAPPPAHDVGGRETGETAPALAGVSTEVLQRTLKRRIERHRPGGEERHRPEPALLAGVVDSDLVAECTRRLKPVHMARLMKQMAPLHAAE
jgi:putative DNA primase/helicase